MKNFSKNVPSDSRNCKKLARRDSQQRSELQSRICVDLFIVQSRHLSSTTESLCRFPDTDTRLFSRKAVIFQVIFPHLCYNMYGRCSFVTKYHPPFSTFLSLTFSNFPISYDTTSLSPSSEYFKTFSFSSIFPFNRYSAGSLKHVTNTFCNILLSSDTRCQAFLTISFLFNSKLEFFIPIPVSISPKCKIFLLQPAV